MIEIGIPRVHVIGMGEVGRRLAGALHRAGVAALPVTRTQGWDEARQDRDGLCLVCVREESLAEADCVLVVTDHSSTDYEFLARHAPVIVDTRNAFKNIPGENIHRL